MASDRTITDDAGLLSPTPRFPVPFCSSIEQASTACVAFFGHHHCSGTADPGLRTLVEWAPDGGSKVPC
jgi:hypothetical protein